MIFFCPSFGDLLIWSFTACEISALLASHSRSIRTPFAIIRASCVFRTDVSPYRPSATFCSSLSSFQAFFAASSAAFALLLVGFEYFANRRIFAFRSPS